MPIALCSNDFARVSVGGVLKIKHNPQRRVNAAHLIETEVAHALAKSTGIDRRGLFS
jgi:hypothetical protein